MLCAAGARAVTVSVAGLGWLPGAHLLFRARVFSRERRRFNSASSRSKSYAWRSSSNREVTHVELSLMAAAAGQATPTLDGPLELLHTSRRRIGLLYVSNSENCAMMVVLYFCRGLLVLRFETFTSAVKKPYAAAAPSRMHIGAGDSFRAKLESPEREIATSHLPCIG